MELQRLSVLFGGISNCSMAYAFVRGMPDQVKRLRASTRMDDLSIDQMLACDLVIMKVEAMEEGMVVAAVRTTPDETRELPCGPISCHRCNSPNHFAKDCAPEG